LDEGNALDTVLDRREDHLLVRPATVLGGADSIRRFRIDIGKTLQVALRMAGRNAGDTTRGPSGASAPTREQALRLAERGVPELVRLFLRPFQPALGAVNAQGKAAFVARRYLACPQHTAGSALEAHHDMYIVVEVASRDKGREIGGKRLKLKPGDEAGQIVSVRADVADTAPGARACRVGPPLGLLLPAVLDLLGEPVLHVLGMDQADCAELAGGDHGARLPDHRIAGVVVGEHKDEAALLHEL